MLLRKSKNKTQVDVAEKMNIKQQYVSELEKQKHINGETLDRILKAMNSNRDEFEKFKRVLPPHLKIN